MAKATSSSNHSKYSLEIHFIIFALLLIFATWSVLLRIYPDFTLSSNHFKITKPSLSSSKLQSSNDHEYLNKLIEETTVLLSEISALNVTGLGIKLENDREKVKNDVKHLQDQLIHADDKLTDCLRDHKELITKVHNTEKSNRECELKVTELQQQSSTVSQSIIRSPCDTTTDSSSSSSSSSSSTSINDMTTSYPPYWLIIGIPTVSRQNSEDYLLQTLASIATQLPTSTYSLFYHKILIVVVNIEGSTHTRFYEAKEKYSKSSHPTFAPYFKFISVDENNLKLDPKFSDPKDGSTAENDWGNANIPGYKVRKQTRDISYVLQSVLQLTSTNTTTSSISTSSTTTSGSASENQYYLFLEDDMLFCSYGFEAIQYLLEKSTLYHHNWLAVRASYGMNGIFMHYKDIQVFSQYLLENQVRRPPDHLVVEWYAGETENSKKYKGNRANIGFRYNLFDHIGRKSTLRTAEQISFPRCYEPLLEPTVFKVEAFDPIVCPNDDIWPCDVPNRQNKRIKWDMLD